MDRTRLVRVAVLVVFVCLLGVGVVAPGRARSALSGLSTAILREVPEPVIVAVALVLAVAFWFLFFRWFLILCYRAWRTVSRWVYQGLTLVLPESPLVKFAAGAMVMIFAVIVIVGVLPGLIGTLTGPADGPESYVDRLSDDALNGRWSAIVEGDTVEDGATCGTTDASGATDRDGDGLPDPWERAGETPDGAALPGANPDRKDLYVHVNYGADVEPLSSAEVTQLERAWAEMAVENPDGTTGIDLYLDDQSASAGRLPDAAAFDSRTEYDRYYTDARLGPRRCVYRQVVYGELRMGQRRAVAATPGYAAVVDGSRQPGYEGDVDFRVAMTTHAMLHAVAGRVNGETHTSAGWLAGGPGNEFLSRATASDLEERGLYGPAS